jgi:hypothetical protein
MRGSRRESITRTPSAFINKVDATRAELALDVIYQPIHPEVPAHRGHHVQEERNDEPQR